MKSKIQFALSMVTFGTIGLFVRYIDMPSAETAALRGVIGCLFLLLVMCLLRQKISWAAVKKNIRLLLVSGAALGLNWVFLFQAYKNTTIANASLSYYFAPVFVLALSPLVLKEKLTVKKCACIAGAVIGMFLIVGNSRGGTGDQNHLTGIAFGLAAAACYASLMLLNKFIKNLSGPETTLFQLGIAALVLTPYVFLTDGFSLLHRGGLSLAFLFILGIVHTGIGFFLFFNGMKGIKGQSIAALSYIDPATSVFLSAVILSEKLTLPQLIGGLLLLGATFISEMRFRKTNLQIQD